MAHVHDVAAYVLARCGPMTAMKLQKLVYYSQAWSLVWDEKPLFPERIEAWAMGPVVPALYGNHRGQYLVNQIPQGNPEALTDTERETVDAVLGFYGNKSSQWLSDLTHQEKPWQDAREGYGPGQSCENEITHSAMAEFYSSLVPHSSAGKTESQTCSKETVTILMYIIPKSMDGPSLNVPMVKLAEPSPERVSYAIKNRSKLLYINDV